ncbi:hypothetical protein SAMN04487818_10595 [Actinokineospora terrae]|uniref:Uncharacterized protein n=2 Tax=Actinokineospora terrae TaxID=155974 RepID=A0A1H9RUD3_9PSEU|nr:hypothetical protein SAMN04487818_10595 [Actinokineospora terrae]
MRATNGRTYARKLGAGGEAVSGVQGRSLGSADDYRQSLIGLAESVAAHIGQFHLPHPGRIGAIYLSRSRACVEVDVDGIHAIGRICADLLAWYATLTNPTAMFAAAADDCEPRFRITGELHDGTRVAVEAHPNPDDVPADRSVMEIGQPVVDWLLSKADAGAAGDEET